MRKLFAAAATAAIFALLVTRRSPARGGNGNGKGDARSTTTADSSITDRGLQGPLARRNGRLGDHSRRTRRLGVPDEPRLCYQDRNGDGINQWPNDGGDLVYGRDAIAQRGAHPPVVVPSGSGAEETPSAGPFSTPTAGRTVVESTPGACVGRLPRGGLN